MKDKNHKANQDEVENKEPGLSHQQKYEWLKDNLSQNDFHTLISDNHLTEDKLSALYLFHKRRGNELRKQISVNLTQVNIEGIADIDKENQKKLKFFSTSVSIEGITKFKDKFQNLELFKVHELEFLDNLFKKIIKANQQARWFLVCGILTILFLFSGFLFINLSYQDSLTYNSIFLASFVLLMLTFVFFSKLRPFARLKFHFLKNIDG